MKTLEQFMIEEVLPTIDRYWEEEIEATVWVLKHWDKMEREKMNIIDNRVKVALSNLLAVIHHDGGHYEVEHGTLKAIEDARSVIFKERDNFDAETFKLKETINYMMRRGS